MLSSFGQLLQKNWLITILYNPLQWLLAFWWGQTNFGTSLIGREFYILPSGLFLSSKLGFALTGRYSDPTEAVNNDVSSCMVTIMPQSGSPFLRDFWNLETIGITDPVHIKHDDRALENLIILFLIKRANIVLLGLGNLMMLSYQRISMLPLEE